MSLLSRLRCLRRSRSYPGHYIGRFISAVIIASVAAGAAAEKAGHALPDPLVLDEAVAYAMANNFTLQVAQTRIRERGGMLTHAQRWLPDNPELEVSTGFRNRPGSDATDIGIRLSQEFWIAGQGGLLEAAARNRLSAAEAEYEFLRTAIAARTRRAFLEVLWSRESTRTALENLRIARELEAYAKQRFEAGEITRLDLNTARLGTARTRNALEAARAQHERARIELSGLLSVAPGAVPHIKGELDMEPAELPDRGELLDRSLQRRRDLAAAASRIVAARRELDLSRRQIIPNLKVFGFYEKEGGDNHIPGIGISLPLPLFHQYEGETQQSAARLRRSQVENDSLLLAIRREVAMAVTDYNSARSRVGLLTGSMLEAAIQNTALTQEAFKAGQVGSPALSAVQETLLSVREEYLRALRDLIEAGTDLERATGGLAYLGSGGDPNPSTTDSTDSRGPKDSNGETTHE